MYQRPPLHQVDGRPAARSGWRPGPAPGPTGAAASSPRATSTQAGRARASDQRRRPPTARDRGRRRSADARRSTATKQRGASRQPRRSASQAATMAAAMAGVAAPRLVTRRRITAGPMRRYRERVRALLVVNPAATTTSPRTREVLGRRAGQRAQARRRRHQPPRARRRAGPPGPPRRARPGRRARRRRHRQRGGQRPARRRPARRRARRSPSCPAGAPTSSPGRWASPATRSRRPARPRGAAGRPDAGAIGLGLAGDRWFTFNAGLGLGRRGRAPGRPGAGEPAEAGPPRRDYVRAALRRSSSRRPTAATRR